jgi:hypothetical protein
MASNPSQRLIVLMVDPNKTQDLTPVLEKMDWWGDGWKIQQVSLAPYGNENSHVFVAVVLNKEREDSRNLPPPTLG